MASALYPKFKEQLLTAGLDVEADDIRAILIDTGTYTYSSVHDFLDDVAAGSRIAVSTALASKTIVNGVFDAADKTLTAVTGATVEAIIIYKHTGTESTSNLICFIDGLTLTPNGGDVTIQWNASGIFAL
jgi:hypothetical protein